MARHLLAIRQLERSQLEELVDLSVEMKRRVLKGDPIPNMSNFVLGMLFFEDSTRTRVSFEQAARYLQMKTAVFTSSGSSMSKGETLKDTILTLRYERLDGLVMRNKHSGSAQFAAKYFEGPVVNAGDGSHEHPTQALGDAITILERKGRIEGLKVAIVGDVAHSRVARSNAWLLSSLGASVQFVGPKNLMPNAAAKLPGKVCFDLATGIADADVVMCLRLQKERMDSGLIGSISEYANQYQINRNSLIWAAPDAMVMHPGPINRGVEVDDSVADGERSAISAQVENGVFVRIAALVWAFGDGSISASKPSQKSKKPASSSEEIAP